MLILSQARGKKYGKRRRRLEAGVPRGALQTPASRQSKGISTCPQRGYPLARKGDIPFCTRGISLLRERGYPLLHEGDILFARKGISLLRTRRVRPLEASLEMRSMEVSRFFCGCRTRARPPARESERSESLRRSGREFSLVAKRKTTLHPWFARERRFSRPKKRGTSSCQNRGRD